MKRLEGIVLQVERRKITILSSDGEFLCLPHPGGSIQIGEKFSEKLASGSPRPSWSKLFVAAACLAAALFLIVTPKSLDQLFEIIPDRASGYLVIDINPSLELVFDQDMVVSDCRPFDVAAEELAVGWPENEPLPVVLEWLLERFLAMGYLDPARDDNLVLVALIESEQVRVDPEMLADFIDKPLQELNVSAYMVISKVDGDLRKQAGAAELSLNRYLLTEEARKQAGREIPDDYTLKEALGILPNGLPADLSRSVGKAPVKLPAPDVNDLPVGPPTDPTETRGPIDIVPGPPTDRPGPPASLPGPR